MTPVASPWSQSELDTLFASHIRGALGRIDELFPERLLAMSTGDILQEVEADYVVLPLLLREDMATIDVEDLPPAGTRIHYHVPYDGNPALWRFAARTPDARVEGGELILSFEGENLVPEEVRARYEADITAIRDFISHCRSAVETFNRRLRNALLERLEARREKLHRDEEIKSALLPSAALSPAADNL